MIKILYMNDQLQAFARTSLKEGLAKLPEDWQLLFKRMYSHKNVELPIDVVVDRMPEEKLDWAMQQVQKSIQKLNHYDHTTFRD